MPALLLVVCFLLLPAIFVAYSSFTSWDGLKPQVWVGLKNYQRFFTDEVTLNSLKNTFIWVGSVLMFPMTLGPALAMLLQHVWFSKTQNGVVTAVYTRNIPRRVSCGMLKRLSGGLRLLLAFVSSRRIGGGATDRCFAGCNKLLVNQKNPTKCC